LPLLPLTNAAQVFHAQEQYLDSGYVQGLRFISQYSQDPHPIMLNQQLFYTFQGFTDDDAHYVAAFFPLTTAILPDTIEVKDWEAFHANYDAYLAETTAELNQLPPSGFTPDLTLLDALVTSLRIKPGTLVPSDPEEEWVEHLQWTHIMRLCPSSNEPQIWLEDAQSLTTWYPQARVTN
jgi:hypothetical protein